MCILIGGAGTAKSVDIFIASGGIALPTRDSRRAVRLAAQ